jgi:hypothetical protein
MPAGRAARRGIGACSRVLAAAGILVLVILAVAAGQARGLAATNGLTATDGLAATDGQISVQLLPAHITLSPGQQATVDVVISNPTPCPVRITSLQILTPASMTAGHIAPRLLRQIPANGSAVGTFLLMAEPGIEDGDVDVLLGVRTFRFSSGSEPAIRTVTGSLTVNASSATQILHAAFLSFPQKLNDGQTVTAAVGVSNPTPFAFRQVVVTAVDSQDISLRRAAPVEPPFTPCSAAEGGRKTGVLGCLGTLQPGATAVLYIQVTANPRVQTGTEHVAVVVAGLSDPGRQPTTATAVATTPVQVTIFGVDALSPFGLGTLFVLPGLMTVLSFLLLARYVYPRSKELPDTVQFKDPRTLLYVVPPAALVYVVVWLAWGVNLTNQAGTSDVALLFGLGVGLGFVAWVLVAVAYYRHSGRKQFRADDKLDKVLARLQARQAALTLPEVTVGTFSYRYLSDGPGGQVYACSPVKYSFTNAADLPARTRFTEALGSNDIAAVRDEAKHGYVHLRWLLRSTGVTLVDRAAAQLGADQDLISEEAVPDADGD